MDTGIIRFEVKAASEELWAAHYDHLDAISLELEPEEPLLPRAKRRALLLSAQDIPYSNRYYYLLLEGGRAAGYASVVTETPASPTYAANKHNANFNLSVLPEFRRKGLATRLLRHVAAEMAALEPAIADFLTPVLIEPGFRFMAALGGKVSLVHGENRLCLKGLDWALVEAWAAEGARRNSSASIVKTQVIPEGDIKDFCRVYSETMAQQPFGEISMKIEITPEQVRLGEARALESGAEHTTIYAKEADGSVSGLTETQYMPELGHRVWQMLTGVRADCRGRGLGKLLKALMLLHIRETYPGVKYIVTGNADSNAPMMAINKALGFRKHRPVLIYTLKRPSGLPG
jgi:GNAT superfamily N-acetyltransferase